MAPYFLGRGACEGAIVEGMRDGFFSAIVDFGFPVKIRQQCLGYLPLGS